MRSKSVIICYSVGLRGVAQPGSASALGAEGREFESHRPDQYKRVLGKYLRPVFYFTTTN
ncbi:MAG: hypothetical protein RI904_636 [Pseudomonadota bacterium]